MIQDVKVQTSVIKEKFYLSQALSLAFRLGECHTGSNLMNYFQFPVSYGTLSVSWNSQGLLTQIQWSQSRLAVWNRVRIPESIAPLIDELRSYFYRGQPMQNVPWNLVDQSQWTEFQAQVYRAISQIPHGETRTYGWVAHRIGKTMASRAVGQALRKNPLPILIPCHRILANQSLGGFMGSIDPQHEEMQLKKRLLSIEEEYRSPVFMFLKSSGDWNSSLYSASC